MLFWVAEVSLRFTVAPWTAVVTESERRFRLRGGVLLRASQDFCARRLADASLANLSTDGIANDFFDNRLKRRGTIANGKLEGTAIAAYWNLERAPKQ